MCLRQVSRVPYKFLKKEYEKLDIEELDFHFKRMENITYLMSRGD